MRFKLTALAALSLASTQVFSAPFTQCPSEGFLVQDKVARLYSVNLAGSFQREIAPSGWTSAKLNALAFNTFDNYLYAYDYALGDIVKIGEDFNVQGIGAELGGMSFYVGDISTDQNLMYLYRKGSGIYRVSLDDSDPDFAKAELVENSQSFAPAIFDMAFHPYDGKAYAVDRNGVLLQIDVETPENSIELGNVGQSGTFGAAYFDASGYLYISSNSDGYVYQIDVAASVPTATLFFKGPASSNNDGARCAFAPLSSAETAATDFGRAPDSYGTTLAENGARHGAANPELYLGDIVSYEADAHLVVVDSSNDNDGVQLLTDLKLGQKALLQLTASNTGFVSAWIDLDGNGEFDTDEVLISDLAVASGVNRTAIAIPNSAVAGETWMRVRFSSGESLAPTGGAADGEVEDYPVTIAVGGTTELYYPRKDTYATIAFEDNWPLTGDYDMNDVVIRYRLSQTTTDDQLNAIKLEGEVVAMGASYHNGFALRLSGLDRNMIDEANIAYTINGADPGFSPLETDRQEAIIIVAEDLHDYVTPGEECKYYRTEAGCGSSIQMTFSITVPVVAGVSATELGEFPLDPFIFATPGFERSYIFGEAPGRRFEIHLKNQAPTEAFQMSFFGRGEDSSVPANGEYFANTNGMPWALNIPYEWQHPLEYMDITYAYPKFREHVRSKGTTNLDWYLETEGLTRNIFSN